MPNASSHHNVDRLLQLLLQQEEAHALIFINRDTEIIGWLAGAERIFGYRPEEILGESMERLFTPEDVARQIPQHELTSAEKHRASEDDRWQIRKDGGRFWANGIAVALRDEHGEVAGYAKILRNRTDQLMRIESLEKRIEGLEALNQRKDRQIAAVAHELRGPLAPLTNSMELIRLLLPAADEVNETIELMQRQLTLLERLINDLLDATRIKSGKLRLRKSRFDLREILQTVVDSSQAVVNEYRQKLNTVLPSIAMMVEADRDRLHQVFSNLITNAARYSEPDGQIWLRATIEEDDAVIRVEDKGVGISAEMLPRIFDLFAQEEEATEQSVEGLGIGLALVKNIVALHNGQVLVRSDGKSRGAEFTIRLPLASEDPDEAGSDA